MATPPSEDMQNRSPMTVLDFWQAAGPARWFTKDLAFDAEFRRRFQDLYDEAAAGRLDAWADTARGALALILLLDQFPRNAFRDTARMYATDPLARSHAERAVASGFDEQADRELRIFFYLPLSHSEDLAAHDLSVKLHQKMGEAEHAIHHRDIIRRFGRFPHRNAILGRTTTAEEQAYLDAGGFSG